QHLQEAEHVAVVRRLVERVRPEGKVRELWSDGRDDHRVERAFEDRLRARVALQLPRRALATNAVAEGADVGGDAPPYPPDRDVVALPLDPGGLDQVDRVGGQDPDRKQAGRVVDRRREPGRGAAGVDRAGALRGAAVERCAPYDRARRTDR